MREAKVIDIFTGKYIELDQVGEYDVVTVKADSIWQIGSEWTACYDVSGLIFWDHMCEQQSGFSAVEPSGPGIQCPCGKKVPYRVIKLAYKLAAETV